MTTAPLCFIDTETTGVHPDRRVWEVAMIRRDPDGTQTETTIQISDVDLSNADPFGLKVGGFYDRHAGYRADVDRSNPDQPYIAGDDTFWMSEAVAAEQVERITRGAHLVGVVPSFDAGCLDPMLRRHQLLPAWHYHLVDVEALAVGYLHGLARFDGHDCANGAKAYSAETAFDGPPTPPWRSDDLSRTCGVEPPTEDERHTALGDARWAMRWYDAMTSGAR